MNFFFTPLQTHFDLGFGATADAFKEAADRLRRRQRRRGGNFMHAALPINYLYRHAVELYLKSFIVLLHRVFQLPYGPSNTNRDPMVRIGAQWKPMYQVHDIENLYDYYRSLLTDNACLIRNAAKTDWTAIPPELTTWIKTINKGDPTSTFFRYPVTKDTQADGCKSSVQEVDPSKLLQPSLQKGKFLKIMIVSDENDNLAATYLLDQEPLPEVGKALFKSCEMLSGAHFGMRIELAGGN